GWKLLQAVNLGDATPVVRVPWHEPGIIGKSLDAGARAIIVPMVNSRTEAAAAVRACRYAPAGSRSFGPIRATRQEGADYYRHANDDVVVIPMIETAKAVADLDDILSVPGVDAIYVGPADLSVSLGLPPGNNDDEPAFVEAYETIVKGCRDHGVVPGCHASAELCARRTEQGFRMITITSDALALARATGEDVAMARGATSGPSAEIY
ncbi:MAG: HpcH/HpaI aldolase/citrate lyase family protein, partial [Acidimicrobiales bacterium]